MTSLLASKDFVCELLTHYTRRSLHKEGHGLKWSMSIGPSLPWRYFPLLPPHPTAVRRHVLRPDQGGCLGSGSCCANGAESASEPGPLVAQDRPRETVKAVKPAG